MFITTIVIIIITIAFLEGMLRMICPLPPPPSPSHDPHGNMVVVLVMMMRGMVVVLIYGMLP